MITDRPIDTYIKVEERNRAVIGLGCNIADNGENRIKEMVQLLAEHGEVAETSSIYTTRPFGSVDVNSGLYTNAVVSLLTHLTLSELNETAKSIERILGRGACGTSVQADIDIVIWNGTVLREKEITRDYFSIGYNQIAQYVEDYS